jgi:hypothetical protein
MQQQVGHHLHDTQAHLSATINEKGRMASQQVSQSEYIAYSRKVFVEYFEIFAYYCQDD